MEKLLVIFSAFFLWSCIEQTGPKSIMEPNTHYKKEMIVVVDGVAREGVITMPLKPEGNRIRVVAKSDLNIMVVETCQAIDSQTNAWNITETIPSGPFGWFSKTLIRKRESEFIYKAEGVAKTSDCQIQIRGYSIDGGHSEASIGFQTPEYQLKGQLICNKALRTFDGYEKCQTGHEKVTELYFEEPVRVVSQAGCSLGESKDGKSFKFAQPLGDCLFTFKGKISGLMGKFETYGFTFIPGEVK